ncbi:MAG: NACHT domain-containing protein [Microcoleus sp. CSU_2_2]|nr:NACHT domain-containing protein [Microcoleus sp. SU_5_3]NJS11228.1 NACHT domain-containing protein [Microcoleus sp. CSU_2_2]
MPFPDEFLTEIARAKKLTDLEIAVFLLLFGQDKNKVKIALDLDTTETVVSTRLTGIYKKFGINDRGPVKERELRRYLEEQQKRKPASSLSNLLVESVNDPLDALVQQVRSRLLPVITAPDSPIGTMKMLPVSQLVPVDKIYIDLNVLEQLSCSSHFSDWRQKFDLDNSESFDRLGLGRVRERRVEALSAVKDYRKLMVLGKPGAGKTTLLKSLAVECVQPETELFADLVPLFVTLRDFAKKASETQSWKLLDYLTWLLAERWNGCDRASAEQILTQGRSLVLLDGLDEVPPDDLERVLDAVREFGYRANRLIITCRTQSQRDLDGFTDVEVADFTLQQVDRFVDNWFKIVDSGSEVSLAPLLQQQLLQKENKPIAELAVTPVLLNLICVVFKAEQGNLPEKRFNLYDRAMRVLLKRLDGRSPIDKTLTFDAKEKFLAELAFMLFQNNDYFPEQRTLEEFIKSYFGFDRFVARKILEIFETETGLLIERSEGYWSFSHLTFHEYFVAQKILKFNGQATDSKIEELLNRHILDNNWHEVFRLISEQNVNE